MTRFASTSTALCVATAVVAAAVVPYVSAHDIPNDVVVQAFLKPEGRRLRLLVRVPLKAMLDVEFPTREAGYLDLARAERSLRDATTIWIARNVELYEEDVRLPVPTLVAVAASLPSDPSFRRYVDALAHVTGPPLSNDVNLHWEQGMLDALLEYPIASDRSRFAIAPGLERLGLRVTIALRLLTPDGRKRAFELHDDPGLVRLDPRWHQAAKRFAQSGFFHILDGTDHLLFLLCLVIPLRRISTLVGVVTSFTVAHSITLIASAYELSPTALWFSPLVETLIAASIVYMALENIVGARVKSRWIVAFAFGLVHGFGFSFALRDTLQFAGSHLLTALFSFNLGIEAGQLFVLLVAVPLLGLLFRLGVEERIATIILSALVAHTGWHWMTERGAQLSLFPWPRVDLATLATAARVTLVIVAAVTGAWVAALLLGRRAQQPAPAEPIVVATKTGPNVTRKHAVAGGAIASSAKEA